MKIKYILPVLFITVLFTSCVERIVTITGQNTTHPEFSAGRENFKSRISEIINSEDISISSGSVKTSGETAYNFLSVDIISSTDFPSGGIKFSKLAGEIAKVVEEDIENIDDYKKLKIEVSTTVMENDTEHTRTFRKEISL